MTYQQTTILKTIRILTLFTVVYILSPAITHAQTLVVNFEQNPLFSEANFVPGNEVIRTVEVTNNTDTAQNVLAEAINAIDTSGLGDVLRLIVTETTTTLYTGTLGTFLRAGEIPLSTLGAGESTTYSFGITFDIGANNDTQATNLGFDLCIGFEGGTSNCGGIVVSDEGDTGGSGGFGGNESGGGGGILGPTEHLSVWNEQATNTGTETTTVTIKWDSNFLSTSQVIYGKQSEGPYNIDLTINPYFGYPLGTVEDPIKVTYHSVQLTDLEVGETYIYRVVSRASPPTVGYQFSFALGEDGIVSDSSGQTEPNTPTPTTTSSPKPTPNTSPPSSESSDGTAETPPGAQKNTENDTKESNDDTPVVATNNSQIAGLGLLTLPSDFSAWLTCIGIFLMFVVLIYLVWAQFGNKNSENNTQNESAHETQKRRHLFFFAGSLVSILIASLANFNCVILPLTLLAGISLLLYLYHQKS